MQTAPKQSETEYNNETLVIHSKDKMSFEEQSSEDQCMRNDVSTLE
jgi:hypothetical protein